MPSTRSSDSDRRTIAIIGGTGQQGFGLVLRLITAGENVIIGSRSKPKAEEAVTKVKETLGKDVHVEGLENANAVAKATITILTVPLHAQIKTLQSLRKGFKEGDIIVDVTVPLERCIGGKSTRTVGLWRGSAAQQAAELVPSWVRVVSAFHTVSAQALQKLEEKVDSDVIVCSDDERAKGVVMDLAEEIPGVRAVDGGMLDNARIVEQLAALLICLNIRYGVQNAGVRITGVPHKTA